MDINIIVKFNIYLKLGLVFILLSLPLSIYLYMQLAKVRKLKTSDLFSSIGIISYKFKDRLNTFLRYLYFLLLGLGIVLAAIGSFVKN